MGRRRCWLRSPQLVSAALLASGAALILFAVTLLPASPGRAVAEAPATASPRDGGVPAETASRRPGVSPAPAPPPAQGSRPVGEVDAATAGGRTDVPVAQPTAVEIPRLDVHSPLVGLDLADGGTLEVPTDPDVAGWFVRGPRPGQPGAAVIAGHVDSYAGPAVFWGLRELGPGDRIVVHREDGSAATFTVERVGRWPKNDFPTDAVYRQASGAELRLITCGGTFDRRARSYRDNVVVFASAV